ncbi:MAG: AP-1 complex subunit sigma-1-like protein [Amphiamblys sp. WSBS2006]|nr:MAG: AP-1 complex subunit sigma-1-like protein [Amphiamblys sp. WSBS2006]
MDVDYLLLVNTQGVLRLERWLSGISLSERRKTVTDLSRIVSGKNEDECCVFEYNTRKIVFRRYASLYFIAGVPSENTNELAVLETIHRYVQALDACYTEVCELDIIFDFQKAYFCF